ncbi:unnamed protein product [Orchesella dallaii]|uniref:Uncharacterized protein n=1 Tax=Orchesella dallaii TaxID=48710 RepID=A0ABP1QFF7_9HEXA
MGKVKGRGDEHACRVNFLFQASRLVAQSSPSLAQYYGEVVTVITDKTAANKDFTMKRSICKKCKVVLTIGVNATYRLRKNKHKRRTPNIVITCTLCGEKKCLPTNRGYQLKAEAHGLISDERNLPSNPSPPNANSPSAVSKEDALTHESNDESILVDAMLMDDTSTEKHDGDIQKESASQGEQLTNVRNDDGSL